jgi:hypothetical protein
MSLACRIDPALGVTLGVALLGALLGIINLLRAIGHDRIRLHVSAGFYARPPDMRPGIYIEAVNLGYLSVTVSQIGFLLSDARKQIAFPDLFFLRQESLPYRLEPRAMLTAYVPAGRQDDPAFASVTRAFAKTACGLTFTGTSPYLKDCIKAARAAKKRPA